MFAEQALRSGSIATRTNIVGGIVMRAFSKSLIAAGAIVSLGASAPVAAQAVQTDAYATSGPANQVWKNPFGMCWRTIMWSPEKAIAECDPDLVKKPAPKPMAAAPAPALVPAPPPPPPPPVAAPVPAPAPLAVAPVVAPPPPVRDVVVLKGVNFATNSAQLTPSSATVLDEVAATLVKRNDIRAEVAGHTDDRGAADYNRSLSQKRAESVRGYLVSKGVDASRLTARGYGEDSPIADNKTDKGRAENRRVELRALK
jgi:OOP family OmpA-OmpF porin